MEVAGFGCIRHHGNAEIGNSWYDPRRDGLVQQLTCGFCHINWMHLEKVLLGDIFPFWREEDVYSALRYTDDRLVEVLGELATGLSASAAKEKLHVSRNTPTKLRRWCGQWINHDWFEEKLLEPV